MPPANVAANDSLDDRLVALLGELLEEERYSVADADVELLTAWRGELRGRIEEREAELADENALNARFDEYIAGQPETERPRGAAQVALSFDEWKSQLRLEVGDWQFELDLLENRSGEGRVSATSVFALNRFREYVEEKSVRDKRLPVKQTRVRVERLLDQAAREAGFVPGDHPLDRATLCELYEATGGENWIDNTNWCSDAPLNEWHGVTTDADGNVTALQLTSNNLDDKLYGDPVWHIFSKLQHLRNLHLGDNKFGFIITGELSKLTYLEQLDLSNNALMWGVPVGLANLANLQQLNLSNNSLDGEIPAELGNLASLRQLNLSNNSLAGKIPAELGNLASLRQLNLSNNLLTSEIPAELGSLVNLQMLVFSHNHLTGQIPVELGALANLEWLLINDNQLTGQVPAELSNLTNLELLVLDDNQLTGQIPPELGNLLNLYWLRLSNNQLTGEVPARLGNLVNLDHRELRLHSLFISGNRLTGCVPSALRDVSNNDLGSLGLPFCDE